MSDREIRFEGERRPTTGNLVVQRHLDFDRTTGRNRDVLEASWGSATAFEGRCK